MHNVNDHLLIERAFMSEPKITVIILGIVGTNCYVVGNQDTGDAVIIDPGDDADAIIGKCTELRLRPSAILLTHGHFDHILAASEVASEYSVAIYAGENELSLLADSGLNGSHMIRKKAKLNGVRPLKDGEKIVMAGFDFTIISTPGHTAGGVCYYLPEHAVLFSGDTLFSEDYGRTDLPTGSLAEIARSIKDKLFSLPDATVVYPGHEESTTIGREKTRNSILFV